MIQTTKHLSLEEKINFLRVIRTKNIGPISFFYLFNTHKDIKKIIQYLETKVQVYSREAAINEIEKIERFGAKLVAFCEPEYPALLKKLRDAPPLITVKGNLDLLKRNAIAVAGSRSCSIQAQSIATKISREMGQHGYVIVSGLARGIDTKAHEASMHTGTIAVLASGIDQIYPTENENLYHDISQKGLLLSEVAFGTTPATHLFPNRNRIIAGLSMGVVIIEAGIKSGSLITAQYGLDIGREIFAVPGCPLDPRSRGTNRLIKQGAHLIESSEDILSEIQNLQVNEPLFEYMQNSPTTFDIQSNISETQDNCESYKKDLFQLIGFLPVGIDTLANKLALPINKVRSILVQLEIEGKIRHVFGNRVCINKQ